MGGQGSFVAEPELEADGLAQDLQQPLAPVLGLLRGHARRKRHHERGPERVEPLPQRSFERVEERRVNRDDAVLVLDEHGELVRGLGG